MLETGECLEVVLPLYRGLTSTEKSHRDEETVATGEPSVIERGEGWHKRERPPRTASAEAMFAQKLSEACASPDRLPLFLLGGFLRGLLLRCHWVILLV